MSLHPLQQVTRSLDRVKESNNQCLETSPELRELYREREHIEFFKYSALIDSVTRLRFNNRVKQITEILDGAVKVVLIVLFLATGAQADTIASYYTRESCAREGTSGVMANGRLLDDRKQTAASWDHKFGTRLLVKNIHNGKETIVVVTDRGPNKKLYRQGRTIDLSRAAMLALGGEQALIQGLVSVRVEVMR